MLRYGIKSPNGTPRSRIQAAARFQDSRAAMNRITCERVHVHMHPVAPVTIRQETMSTYVVHSVVARPSVVIRFRFAARVYHLSPVNAERNNINPDSAPHATTRRTCVNERLRSDTPNVYSATSNVTEVISLTGEACVVHRLPGADVEFPLPPFVVEKSRGGIVRSTDKNR